MTNIIEEKYQDWWRLNC